MQPNTQAKVPVNTPASDVTNSSVAKTPISYKIFLLTLIVVPLIFLPTRYVASDLVKSIAIVLGTVATLVIYLLAVYREKQVSLPPARILVVSILLCLSAITSSLLSIHPLKSLFGQGFEIGTTAFLIILFSALWVAYESIRRSPQKILKVYNSVVWVFLALVIYQIAVIIVKVGPLSLGVLQYVNDTFLGKWYDLGLLGAVVLVLAVSALMFLDLSRLQKIFYYLTGIAALVAIMFINNFATWFGLVMVFALGAVALYVSASKVGGTPPRLVKRIPWMIVVLFLLSVLFLYQGSSIMRVPMEKTGTGYQEIALSWQSSLDIITGSIKNYPLFGVGPNHYAQAFMIYKPQGLNATELWSVEFNSGFGTIPSYFVTMGGMGAILWILFLVFIGAAVTKVLRNMPADPIGRFIAFVSSLTTVFLWVSLVLYVPSHAMIFLTFAFTGIFLAISANMGILKPYNIAFVSAYSRKFILPVSVFVVLALLLCIVFVYGKKTIALSYFVSGLQSLNQRGDYVAADTAFHKALQFDKSDAYWRAISENHRLHANQIISTATSSSPEITNAVTKEIVDGVEAAQNATKYNPSNYYNPFSEARISQLGASIKMDKAYDNAVRAYTHAINLNPYNPSLYANLAQLQASNEKYDDALQSLGAALQVKNNYLDAVFLLSQVHAARNDLPNAIIAAKVAIQLNPQNSILYFQLGLLYYNSANYDESYKALSKAVELQPDYANAKYFLGLAAARNGNTAVAIEQFKSLSASNPDNQEITQILNTLRSGKSLFQTTSASGAEKRSVLPVKEKR